MFKFADLFAGVGGFHLALKAAGGTPLIAAEIDNHARKTYAYNFLDTPIVEDVMEMTPDDLAGCDVIAAGFPCQPFSVAGAREGFDDKRTNAFLDMIDLIEVVRPKVVIMENVRGFLSHDNYNTAAVVQKMFRDIGYNYRARLFDASQFGVPQKRIRVYMVAWLGEGEMVWPEPTFEPTRLGDIIEPQVDNKYMLTERTWTWIQAHTAKHKSKRGGFDHAVNDHDTPYTRTITARYFKDGKEALFNDPAMPLPRRMTPREVARLQTFPDDFHFPVSNTQAYKQMGNAVTVKVATLVAQAAIELLTPIPQAV